MNSGDPFLSGLAFFRKVFVGNTLWLLGGAAFDRGFGRRGYGFRLGRIHLDFSLTFTKMDTVGLGSQNDGDAPIASLDPFCCLGVHVPFLDPPKIRRIYSLAEANAALPLVEPIVRDLMKSELRVRHLDFRLKFIRRGPDDLLRMFSSEIRALERELEQANTEYQRHIKELDDLGIEPEGPSIGLVDFPSKDLGRTVFLCWQCGEPQVEYWHSLTGGFPDRSRLPCDDSRELMERPVGVSAID